MWYLILAISLYVFIYTVSYGVWEWKHFNKSAAVVIFAMAVVAVGIPVVKIFV